MSGDLAKLQKRLGYKFGDPALLARALTHATALDSARGIENDATYQRLEFLGDRVLGLVIADLLMKQFPQADEGELSRRLHRLVSGDTCADVAREMDLDPVIRTGDSIARSRKRLSAGIRADVCEAVIAAVYRDGGLKPAGELIARYWAPRVAGMSGPLRDAKTELQEWAHSRGFGTPVYREISRSGPDHAPRFVVAVEIAGDLRASGEGRSKRIAEQEAAETLLIEHGVRGQ